MNLLDCTVIIFKYFFLLDTGAVKTVNYHYNNNSMWECVM